MLLCISLCLTPIIFTDMEIIFPGRVLFFTSGSENVHFVEPVKAGERYAITISFTCDREKGISDLKFSN